MASTIRTRRKQVERREEAERRLLEAGIRLVAERGLDDFSLADVGTAAGYSRGLPVHHFGSKAAFTKQLISFVMDEYKRGIEGIGLSKGEGGLPALMELITSYFRLAATDPTFLCVGQIVLSDKRGSQSPSAEIQAAREATVEAFQAQIQEGIRKGEIHHDTDPELASLILITACWGVLEIASSNPKISINRIGEELAGICLKGLAVRSSVSKV